MSGNIKKFIPIQPISAAASTTLAGHAVAIRTIGERLVTDAIEIGRRLTEAKALAGHGNWLPWLRHEFDFSDKTAEKWMRCYELSLKFELGSNFEPASHFDLPLSAFYQLAAPSTPPEAVEAVIERAGVGEKLSGTEVKKIVQEARSPHAAKPTKDREPLPPAEDPEAEEAGDPEAEEAGDSEAEEAEGEIIPAEDAIEYIANYVPQPSSLALDDVKKVCDCHGFKKVINVIVYIYGGDDVSNEVQEYMRPATDALNKIIFDALGGKEDHVR